MDEYENWKNSYNEWKKKQKNLKQPDKPPEKTYIPDNSDIWGDLKHWLLKNVFHDKCAYCETPLDRSFPPAEHHRPKGRVTYRRNGDTIAAMTLDEAGEQFEHPGYFWLAYHWKNLVPSCDKCNSGEGKQNQFPISSGKSHVLIKKLTAADISAMEEKPLASKKWPGLHYLPPGKLNEEEEPQLLHPYLDDPEVHLVFGDRGIIAAKDKSTKGSQTIGVLTLDKLDKRRFEYQQLANSQYLGAMIAKGTVEQKKERAEEAIADFRSGKSPYSRAACDYLKLVWEFGAPNAKSVRNGT
ncbi:MAG TPA: hypothetical protein VJ723_07860 [Candidatus Angelobacter sp.]|nr:hypothetical protein [Candidatus Angelobacter sp.]